MQNVCFGNQHCLGDDETTIVFTNNSTRIITNIEQGNNEDDNDNVENDDNNVTREYERLSIELAPTFEGMIKEVMNLPDDHEAWAYMNPTMYFFGNQTSNLFEQKAQYVKDFQNWLDGTLFINHEFKEQTKSYNLTQPSQDEYIHVAVIEENNLRLAKEEEQGSSSVEEKSFQEITWGTRKTPDNEEDLHSWLRTNIPSAEKRNGDKDDESNLEEITLCSVCEKEMFATNIGINTCTWCQEWIKDSLELIAKKDDKEKCDKGNSTKIQRDDETEFKRIPIAGENESDYEDSRPTTKHEQYAYSDHLYDPRKEKRY
jgi:hypothetical protein